MFQLKKFNLLTYLCYLFLPLILLSFPGCGSSISVYDQYAYTQTVSLKVDALSLMDKADQDVILSTDEITLLKRNIEKIYEYEKGRPLNEISSQMWNIMKDPDKHMIGGYIKRWEEEKILRRTFIDEAKELVGKGFDLIAELESGKITSDDVKNYKLIIFN